MLKIPRLSALLFLLFLFSASIAQDKRIDSIKTVFQNPKVHDTTKLSQLDYLLRANYNQNDPNYYYIVNWMGKLAQKALKESQNPKVRTRANMYLGTFYNGKAIEAFMDGKIDKSVAYEDKAIAIYKAEKNYDEMYYQYIIKAQFLYRMNETEKAISCLFSALKYYDKDKAKNLGEIAYASTTLGNIYAVQGKFKEAVALFEKINDYYDSDSHLAPMQKNNMKAVNYGNIGNSYQQLSQLEKAVTNYNKAIALYKLNNDNGSIALVLSKMAAVKLDQKKYDEAEKIFKELLSGPMEKRTEAHNNMQLARLYIAKKEYAKAESYAEKAFTLSTENKFLDLQEIIGGYLYTISKKNGNYKRALEMNEFNYKLKDSSKMEASKNALAQQQLKYDFEKKELQMKLVNQKEAAAKNNGLILLSAIVLLLLLGGFFYYRNNRQQQAIAVFEKNEIRQKLLISQMNPHFIFNSVDTIQGLIFKNRNKEAVDYLNKFSKLTRQILENSNENYISLDEEVLMIENYLTIQQLLHNEAFTFTIELKNIPNPEAILLPPMLTQPFIENAIRHGLADKEEGGRLNVLFYLKDQQLTFEVSDNGKGFEPGNPEGTHKSMAMKITKERLAHYSKIPDYTVHAENSIGADGAITGAKVIFKIPYLYEN
ncbi:MAG: histidine kinase [Flavobacterium sp.]